jgi:hypothetical protein
MRTVGVVAFGLVVLLGIVVFSRHRPTAAAPTAIAGATSLPLPREVAPSSRSLPLARARIPTSVLSARHESNMRVISSETARPRDLEPLPDGAGPFPRRWEDLTPAQQEKFPQGSTVAGMVRGLAALDDCVGDRLGDHRGGMLATLNFVVEPDGQTMRFDHVQVSNSGLPTEDDDRIALECLEKVARARPVRPIDPELLRQFTLRPGDPVVGPSDYHFPVRSDPWFTWLASQ